MLLLLLLGFFSATDSCKQHRHRQVFQDISACFSCWLVVGFFPATDSCKQRRHTQVFQNFIVVCFSCFFVLRLLQATHTTRCFRIFQLAASVELFVVETPANEKPIIYLSANTHRCSEYFDWLLLLVIFFFCDSCKQRIHRCS